MLKKLIHYINLEGEIDDFGKIHASIEKDIIFKGTNLWILMFAIIVASVGLNMNSTAVIIGAMLISPLMGPINGMGYSIATYNFPLFRRALNNFVFAVGASIFASTVYFAISPVSTAHSELLARTSPTIYDVLIALFGGMAGIVAISSKQKGNVIPGVAIATALMPPLCTAGYGLATAQFSYFFGAFYLFTINTVFIAFAATAISVRLKFPVVNLVNRASKIRVTRWISTVLIITIVPSIYFGYGLVQKEKFISNANKFTQFISVVDASFLLKSDVNPTTKTITLIYGGKSLTDQQEELIRERARTFSLGEANLFIKEGFSSEEDLGQNDEVTKLKLEINRLSTELTQKSLVLDTLLSQRSVGAQLFKEIVPMFPRITGCTYAESFKRNDGNIKDEKISIVIFITKQRPLLNSEKEKISKWLTARLKTDVIKVFYEVQNNGQ